MVSSPGGNVTVLRALQLRNISPPTDLKPVPNTTLVRFLHSLNVFPSVDSSESGNRTE